MTPTLPSLALPGTDRRVTRVGLGAMHLSIPGRPPRDEAVAVVRRGVEAGVRLIDTADAYSLDATEHGHNEELVAEALNGMGIDLEASEAPVVATKGGRSRPDGQWALDARPERLREACHGSLRRLGVERIPLYQLHQPDPDVPFADSVGALARLREEGKVEAVGLSNVSVEQIREAADIVPIASVQNRVSPWDAGRRRAAVVAHCEEEGIVLMAYGPLGGRERVQALGESTGLRAVAGKHDATAHEVVLAWLLTRSDTLVPIPGATRPESVESSARAASLELDEEDRRAVLQALEALPGRPGLAERAVRKVGRVVRSLLGG